MRFKFKMIFGCIISILFIYVILATSIDFNAFYRPFYQSEFNNLNTAAEIGMTNNDLFDSMNTLLDYLEDQRDDIVVSKEVQGIKKEIFSTREKLHMIDVKNLYLDAMFVRNVCLMIGIGLILFLWLENKHELLEVLTSAYLQVCTLFILMLVALLIYACSDFTTFWNQFHGVFFSNDLWLLNPNTSIMINMLPETLFYHLVIRIVVCFSSALLIPYLFSIYYQRRLRKKVKQINDTLNISIEKVRD